MILISWTIALAALIGNSPSSLPVALATGEPVQTEGFIGIEWVCDPSGGWTPASYLRAQADGQPLPDIEFCYAGATFGGPDGSTPAHLIVGP